MIMRFNLLTKSWIFFYWK